MLLDPLPPRPSLEHYRKRAKKLARTERCTLARAHFSIARAHGFESWPRFVKHLEGLAKDSPVSRFEAAADAIAGGDAASLKRLLHEDPKLIRMSSTREHGATLLHYVSANGVEDFRQRTPHNIVEIAEMLLHAGAEVDAMANVYGGGCTTLGLAATSIHPVRAGVLEQLLEALLRHGASLELASVRACLANGRPQGAEFLVRHGARLNFVEAAGIGRLDLTKRLFDGASVEQQTEGFGYACEYGRKNVVQFLLEKDAGLVAQMANGQTGLHMAAIGGQLEIVKLLLPYKPPLDVQNRFGGTVLGQTLWSAAHGGDPDVTLGILEALVAAGAPLPQRHVPVNARVDRWLAERGSRVEE